MKPRDFLNFFKTKSGKLVAFGALFAAALVIFSVTRKQHPIGDDGISVASLTTNITDKPQVVQSVSRPLLAFNPPPLKTSPLLPSQPSSVTNPVFASHSPEIPHNIASTHPAETLAPISLFPDSTAGIVRPKKLGGVYAPFGRLISCETVVTVDSASIQTPIIGLITENVYFRGKLVIPAGTEIHGTAQTDHQRERIASGSSWTLVWQNGMELQIKAIALDREFDDSTNQSGWAITDGSAGLRGEVIKTDDFAEIKLFAATFLSGAASSLTEQQQTLLGSMPAPTLGNAPFQGAQAVLQTYAQQIYDSIKKDGFYVRVPSGKQFYLYVLQTIDPADATPGGEGFIAMPEKDQSSTIVKP